MSGIYIKGMEMPKNCCECFAFKSNANGYLFCKAKRIAFGKEDAEWLPLKTPNWCPLIPVPDHGDLIDRDPFVQFIKSHWDSSDQWFVEQLEARPAIVPADKEGEG